MTVWQDDESAKKIVEKTLKIKIASPFSGLLVSREAGVTGALIFNGFDRWNVDLTVVAIGSWSMKDLRDIARYIFIILGVKRVSCLTLSTNKQAINRLLNLGFEQEGLLKNRFPQGDAVLFGLQSNKQKILRLEHEPTTST